MLTVVDLTLLAIYALLPGVVIAWGNDWRSWRVTVLRCLSALVAAWLWLMVAGALSADLELWLGRSEADRERATFGDGPRMHGVTVLGWAPSAVLVALWWALSPGRWRAKRCRAA